MTIIITTSSSRASSSLSCYWWWSLPLPLTLTLTLSFALIQVVLLAELLSTVDTLRAERAEQLERVRQLERRLDERLFASLMERVQTLRPKVERDGLGVTELEFAMSMLLELGMIEYEQVRPFLKQFRKLDVTGNGRVGENDLKLAGMANGKDGLHLNLGVRGGRRGTIHAAALKQRLQQRNGKPRRVSMPQLTTHS